MDSKRIAAILREVQSNIYQGHFEVALASLASILDTAPEHIEALYMKAVCLRYKGSPAESYDVLHQIKVVEPEFGRAFQEEGHLHLAAGKIPQAINAYRLACDANPALDASWRKLSDLLQASGKQKDATQAQAQADRLTALPRELLAASNFLHEGKLLKAETLCRRFLKANPHHIEAMRLLADVGGRLGSLEDADFLLESALEFDPGNVQVRLDHIAVLRKRQKFEAALQQAKYLLDQDPENPVFLSHYAIECLQANRLEEALNTFNKVLETLPKDPATLTSKGHVLKTTGRHQEAVESYRSAYSSAPLHADAYHGLANLKTYQFTDTELQSMLAAEGTSELNYSGRIQFCFALGKAFEDRHEYEQSFTYYKRGNDLKLKQCRYSAAQMDEEFAAQIKSCNQQLFAHHDGGGCQSPDPIFIVGLPRAGSTLLEQVLASHSQVDGTLELPNIIALAHKLRAGQKIDAEMGYPRKIQTLTPEELASFGESYLEGTRMHRKGARFFIDKMPNNFRHIGLIHLILPNAKIIDARRDPMACCFSGFKQLFAEGQEFTYGLEEVGRYYRGYVGLMEHWDKMLPGKILRVQYEDVVADLDTQVRRMLDYCGLPFEKACLEFHKTERSVRTASSEQVRKPIYKSGLAQWRNFERYLGPLKHALGPLA